MKKVIALLLLFAAPAFAVTTAHVVVSSTNLAATYSTSYPQLTLSGLTYKAHIAIINQAGGTVCCQTETPSATVAPSTPAAGELCVPEDAFMVYDNINIQKNVYCRSYSGTLNSGTFDVQVW